MTHTFLLFSPPLRLPNQASLRFRKISQSISTHVQLDYCYVLLSDKMHILTFSS